MNVGELRMPHEGVSLTRVARWLTGEDAGIQYLDDNVLGLSYRKTHVFLHHKHNGPPILSI